MKKQNLYKFLYVVCVLLILGFCVRIGADYIKYDTQNNSAPFYVFILVRIIEFILPCSICFIGAIITKKKYGCKDK